VPAPPPAHAGWRLIDRAQTELLCERYGDVLLGEPGTLLLLLLQAPLIAGLIVVAWQGSKETPMLHVFLCLAALWVGCMNACREIVKERPIFDRERRVGLGTMPYVLSKIWILGAVDLAAAVSLVWIVHYHVGLSGSRLGLTLVLWLVAVAGTALGLLVSAMVGTSDQAVGLVPVVVLPQILFSPAFLPGAGGSAWSRMFENITILGWGHDLYERVRVLDADPQVGALLKALLALLGIVLVFCGLTAFLLWDPD
jgi:hypothetical protein